MIKPKVSSWVKRWESIDIPMFVTHQVGGNFAFPLCILWFNYYNLWIVIAHNSCWLHMTLKFSDRTSFVFNCIFILTLITISIVYSCLYSITMVRILDHIFLHLFCSCTIWMLITIYFKMSSSTTGTFTILSFNADHLLFGSLKILMKIMFLLLTQSSSSSSSLGTFSIVIPCLTDNVTSELLYCFYLTTGHISVTSEFFSCVAY